MKEKNGEMIRENTDIGKGILNPIETTGGGGGGRGQGLGIGGGGGGAGRMGGRGRGGGFGMGPSGYCVCPNCGEKVPHQRGVPCYKQKCPKCSQPLTRADAA